MEFELIWVPQLTFCSILLGTWWYSEGCCRFWRYDYVFTSVWNLRFYNNSLLSHYSHLYWCSAQSRAGAPYDMVTVLSSFLLLNFASAVKIPFPVCFILNGNVTILISAGEYWQSLESTIVLKNIYTMQLVQCWKDWLLLVNLTLGKKMTNIPHLCLLKKLKILGWLVS